MSALALPLRGYQRDALDSVTKAGLQRVLVALPTGGGKTVCFAHESLEYLAKHPDMRVLVLVHTEELAYQAYEKIRKVAPHLSVGIVKAGRDEVTADVVVGSVQTLRNAKRRARIRYVGHIIVDEAHHAVAQTYRDILDAYPNATVTGYTATPQRGDGKSLGVVWQGLAFQRDISWMIRREYLIPPRGKAIEVPDLDLRNVKATRTDFREGELGEALAESLAPELVAKAIVEHAPDRKVLAFFPTVASAYVFAAAMDDAGLEARVIHGGMKAHERADVLAWHRRGTVLVNCMILTEGYDDPEVDCIVMGRPTKSKPLYIQIIGRGLRRDPLRPYAEQDCLVLDVVGANAFHGDLRSIADLSEREVKEAHDGRTLIELEDDLDAGEGIVDADEQPYYVGEVVTRDFDPLGNATGSVWLRTKAGNHFLPCGTNRYVFVLEYPRPGSWCVATCATRGRSGAQLTDHQGLPLDQAMVWAEDLCLEWQDLNTLKKSAAWRKRPASEKTKNLAKSLGVAFEDGVKGGPLSDAIAEVMGTRRIDPLVAAAKAYALTKNMVSSEA